MTERFDEFFQFAQENRLDEIRRLIEDANDRLEPIDVNRMHKIGATALFMAATHGNEQMTVLLLRVGAHPNNGSLDGATPLLIAAQKGHVQVCRTLISVNANLDATWKLGYTALYVASQNGHDHVVELLLNSGADKDKTTQSGATALYIAAENSHEKVCALLIKAGSNVNLALNESNQTPLYIAAQKGHFEICAMLLTNSATLVNSPTKEGVTPLITAAQKGHLNVCQQLIGRLKTTNQNLNFVWPRFGATALHWAAQLGHLQICEALLEAGADWKIVNLNGNTALELTVAATKDTNTKTKFINLFKKYQSDTSKSTQEGFCSESINLMENSTFHNLTIWTAAKFGNVDYLREFTASQKKEDGSVASLMCYNKWGDTALHVAARYNQRAFMLQLLRAGFLPGLCNSRGQTFLDVIESTGRTSSALQQVLQAADTATAADEATLAMLTKRPSWRQNCATPRTYQHPVCLIFDIVNFVDGRHTRRQAANDELALRNLFQSFRTTTAEPITRRYHVDGLKNATKQRIREEMRRWLCEDVVVRIADFLILFCMSHGEHTASDGGDDTACDGQNDVFLTSDYERIDTKELVVMIREAERESRGTAADEEEIFCVIVFVKCRGDTIPESNSRMSRQDYEILEKSEGTPPGNTLVVYSVGAGNSCWNDPQPGGGSIFVRDFVELAKRHGDYFSLLQLLDMIKTKWMFAQKGSLEWRMRSGPVYGNFSGGRFSAYQAPKHDVCLFEGATH